MKITKILETKENLAALPIRLGLGVVMVAHGAQKLFGWFGGYGLKGTAQFFSENLGLEPGMLMALLAGGGEFFGGLLVLLGLLTRPAAAVIGFTMVMAIVTVHNSAFFLPKGMEYVLVLLLMSVGLILSGGGSLSVDRILGKKTDEN